MNIITNNPLPTKSDLMTLSEVADYLKLAERTVLKMVHKREIPSIKIASQWRFIKEVIDKWLFSKMQSTNQIDVSGTALESTKDYIPIGRLLKEDQIIMDLKPAKKNEILDVLIKPLYDNGLIKNKDYYLSRLLDRENIVSTGLGKGIAIPHIRNVSENPPGINTIVAGICREGTDFDSMDNKKTYLFFLVCSDNEILHIRIIARLSRIFRNNNAVLKFLSVKTKEDFLNLFIKVNHEFNFPVKE